MTDEIRKTSAEWCEQDKEFYEVYDPDGWDRTPGKYHHDFNVKLRTYHEHLECVYISTCLWKRKGLDTLSRDWREVDEAKVHGVAKEAEA